MNLSLPCPFLKDFQIFVYILLQNFAQGCALRAPGCLRRLTFAFGRPDNLISFI